MAITNNGTKVSAPDEQLPSGYTRPTITSFTDHEYYRRVVLSVLKATVESATKTTTMANIIGNGTIGVTKQVTDLVTADAVSSNTVTIYGDIVKVENNSTPQSTGEFFSNVATSYLVTVDIYWKTS
jgi:hypothetical protein